MCLYTPIVPTNTQDNADTPLIAPGAENVGQAQILNTFSKPFELEGLFGAADAGAFGNGADDVAMADEDGDVFWDAVEAMDEDGCVNLPYLSPALSNQYIIRQHPNEHR